MTKKEPDPARKNLRLLSLGFTHALCKSHNVAQGLISEDVSRRAWAEKSSPSILSVVSEHLFTDGGLFFLLLHLQAPTNRDLLPAAPVEGPAYRPELSSTLFPRGVLSLKVIWGQSDRDASLRHDRDERAAFLLSVTADTPRAAVTPPPPQPTTHRLLVAMATGSVIQEAWVKNRLCFHANTPPLPLIVGVGENQEGSRGRMSPFRWGFPDVSPLYKRLIQPR